MRTTVDLPDSLFRQMKATAALQGISIKELITTAIETEIFASSVESVGKLWFW